MKREGGGGGRGRGRGSFYGSLHPNSDGARNGICVAIFAHSTEGKICERPIISFGTDTALVSTMDRIGHCIMRSNKVWREMENLFFGLFIRILENF